MRVEAVDVLVERVDEDPERQVELELAGPAREDEVRACVCAGGQLGEEARLADSRLADELERRGSPLADLGEETVDRAELRSAADEMGRQVPSVASGSTLDQGRRSRNQGGRSGWPPDVGRRRRGRVGPCPATCSTTTTSRTSAASSSPPSAASRARFAIERALASCAFRRPFDLVDGGGRERGERARAAALLRRRAHDGRPGQRGADPVTGAGSRQPRRRSHERILSASTPGASSRSARTTASPSRSSGAGPPAA